MRQWESWLKQSDAVSAGGTFEPARALIVAAPGSGAGKTSLTLGLLTAFRKRGLRVRAAKVGPDYIDPRFHEAATGGASLNLDSWAMPPEFIAATLGRLAADADLIVIEAAMGLFDGIEAEQGRTGAAADLARTLKIPVLLVLDIAGQGRSAAAVAKGFASYDPDVAITALALNRAGSARHRDSVAAELAKLGIPLVGCLPRTPDIGLPARHLGLVQASEIVGLADRLDRLGALVEANFDLAAILTATRPLSVPPQAAYAVIDPPGQRVALALDAAFGFAYPHLILGWRQAGAEILPFSPLADEPPAMTADICWLPGGYPELHAGALAAARRFQAGLRHFAETRPVHGECGGYMALGQTIEDSDGVRHAMTGLLGHSTSFKKRRLHLGYRAAVLLADCPLGRTGSVLRGHEFHYSTLEPDVDHTPLYALKDGGGIDLGAGGARRGLVSGGYLHMILCE